MFFERTRKFVIKYSVLQLFTVLALVTLYFFVSTSDLKYDVINPDGINWHTRTQNFTQALVDKDYGDTYQVYHPGITLMWISGPLLRVFRGDAIFDDYKQDLDPKTTFLDRDYYAKLALVLASTILFLFCLILFWKMIGIRYAAFWGLVFALEPFAIGMRRLYHLDYLMTALMFTGFLCLAYFNYKKAHWALVVLGGFFCLLAVYTKTTAVIFLPTIPFIFLLGNSTLLRKLLGIILFVLSLALFGYITFPAIWRNPIKAIPSVYEKISLGVSDIGIDGKKELGKSGKSDNVTLDDTVEIKDPDFYLTSLLMRLTTASGVLLVVGVGIYLFVILKGFVLFVWATIRHRGIQKVFTYGSDSWVSFWALGFSVGALLALTVATKKTDRYEIIVFPFLFCLIAYGLNKLKLYISTPLILIYVLLVGLELKSWHPYYLAYSNPQLGGIFTRIYALDNTPFGVGSYAAFNIAKNDVVKTNPQGYYTISGSKTVKAISEGGKFSRFPSCVTDYVITFATEVAPTYTCTQKYMLLDTVKIMGFDYWYVYKRLNQRHESNYD